jgi:hypothetical protein
MLQLGFVIFQTIPSHFRTKKTAPVRLYHLVFKSYVLNLSIQGSSIFKMAGKSKSVMNAVLPEEIKKESLSLPEHWMNLIKYNNFGGLSSQQ